MSSPDPYLRVGFIQAHTQPTLAATLDVLDEHLASLDPKPHLLLTPEAFLGGYPRGHNFGNIVGSRSQEGRELFWKYHEQSLTLGPESTGRKRLEEIARKHGVYIVCGAITHEEERPGSLYCSVVFVDPEKGVVKSRNKLMPTAQERTIWAAANPTADNWAVVPAVLNGQKLNLFAAICWENLMPALRSRVYDQGVDIWLAPTADGRESWACTMRHIAMEGRCFVVSCNQVVRWKDVVPVAPEEKAGEEWACRGGGMVVGPMGEVLVEPVWEKEEGVSVELGDVRKAVVEGRMDFHCAGHYRAPAGLAFPPAPTTFGSTFSGGLFGR